MLNSMTSRSLFNLIVILVFLYIALVSIFPPLIFPPIIGIPRVNGDVALTPWVRDCDCGFRNCRCAGRTIPLETVIPPAQATTVGSPVVTNIPRAQTAQPLPTVVTATPKGDNPTPTYPPNVGTVTPKPLDTPNVPTSVAANTPTLEIPPVIP